VYPHYTGYPGGPPPAVRQDARTDPWANQADLDAHPGIVVV
jgi:hypothetical protein